MIVTDIFFVFWSFGPIMERHNHSTDLNKLIWTCLIHTNAAMSRFKLIGISKDDLRSHINVRKVTARLYINKHLFLGLGHDQCLLSYGLTPHNALNKAKEKQSPKETKMKWLITARRYMIERNAHYFSITTNH